MALAEPGDEGRIGPARGHALDAELVRELLHELERAAAHGTGDTEDGEPLHDDSVRVHAAQ